MKKIILSLLIALIAIPYAQAQFSRFGQIKKEAVTTLEGKNTVERFCISPRTVRFNMSEVWISKNNNGRFILVCSLYNPTSFSKTSLPISIDGEIITLTGAVDFDAEIWGYTRGFSGTGGTLFTNTIAILLTEELIAKLLNATEIKLELNVPSQERIDIINGNNLEKVKPIIR